MTPDIEKNLHELSLLLTMVDPGDKTGLEALYQLADNIGDAASKVDELASVARCCKHLKSVRKDMKGAEALAYLEKLVEATQAAVNGDSSVAFPDEGAASGEAEMTDLEKRDLAEHFDDEFLVEFIEKHKMLLEDMVDWIVEHRFSLEQGEATEEDTRKLAGNIKSYLHNIKGDAGTIGLAGINKVTHHLEDIVLNEPLPQIFDLLLTYKEWTIECMEAYSQNDAPPQHSNDFIKILVTSSSEEVEVEVVEESESEDEQSEHELLPREGSYAITVDTELFWEFHSEANDHLQNVESVMLEASGGFEKADIDNIFRGVHSLKGASSFFQLQEINKTSHILENLLDEVRANKRTFDQLLIDLTFEWVDVQKLLLDSAKTAVEEGKPIVRTARAADLLKNLYDYSDGKLKSDTPTRQEPVEEKPKEKDKKKKESLDIRTFVKIDTQNLDRLIDSIGEMVVYSSMLIRKCRILLPEHEEVISTSHQVEKFSRDLQEIGMSMRLDPVKGLFQKMSRLVWDVSKKLGKDVQFKMKGEDTELDRNVIEKLADPLMHMVRNAMDHGIEMPDDREAAGKPRKGTIELSASHAGGAIHIQIKDDGKGLDAEGLRLKAIEKGVISADQHLTREECFNLIFAAGFSTAKAVTDISGRGVGMDVVRNNIEGMRGSVKIESELGKGSTFTIELPLTLAIMDGIETTVGSEQFIIPTLSILEFIRPKAEMISTTTAPNDTFFFRGKYLPLFDLGTLYSVPSDKEDITQKIVCVVENGNEQVALLVDDIVASCQAVIKSLGEMFTGSKGLAGCAVMANSQIGLILDIRSLVSIARESAVIMSFDERVSMQGHFEDEDGGDEEVHASL